MKANELKEKILQGYNRLNEKNPYIKIVGLLIVVFLLDYFLIMQFQVRTLKALNTKIMTLKTDLKKSREDIQLFAAYQNQLKRAQDKFENVSRKIRSKDELPLVLENISRLANKNSIRLEQVMPNTSLMKSVLKNNDGQYFAIPIQVQARSEYHDFGRFLNELENEEIFLRIPEFVIRANKEDRTRHDVELTLQAIVFEEKEKKKK